MSKKDLLRSFNPNDFEIIEPNQVSSFDPNEFEVVSTPKIEKDPFDAFQEKKEKESEFNSIITNIPDMDDGRKQSLKDLVTRGVIKGGQITDVILTYQGKHPKQIADGSIKFYTDEKGVPHPLSNSELPPKEYQINSIWGEQFEAEDDTPLTTLGKNVYNILPSIAENAIDLVHLPYGAITGQEADWYKSLKNSANYLKAKTSEASGVPVLNTQGIDEFSDVFEPERWNFTADNVAGTVGQIVKSVGEFVIGGGFVSKAAGATTKLGKGASLFTASYATQLGETIDRAKEAGLTTEDAYRVGSAINVPIAMVDLALGVEGRLFKDEIAKTGRKELVDNLVSGFIKDSEGKITKEGLDELFKSTIIANTALVKNWGKQTMSDIIGEGSQEAIQAFVQNAGEQLYDKMSDDEKAKFGTDAFSPKAFADYLQNFVVGAIGGAPSGLAYNKIKQITKDNEQSKTAFGLVQQKEGEGTEATNIRINSYKENIENEVRQGKLTREQADNAITRINAYKDYNDMLGSLEIDDTEKRQLFDLSFQKQGLETEIGTIKDPKKLNPIEQAQYNVKEKIASDIQKQINEIVLKAQAKEEVNLSEKTIQDVAKIESPPKKEGEAKPKINPVLQAILDRNKKEKSKPELPEEKRSYEEIPAIEFNKPTKITGGYRTIHKKTVEFLERQPNKTMVGQIVEKPFEYGGKKNKTYGVELPDGKVLRFSSSMERPEGFRGHMRTEHLVKDEELIGFPIGLKVEEIPAFEEGKESKKVIKAFNANTGKFVGYMKETNTGKKQEYNQKQIDYLEHLGTISEPPIGGELIPAKPQPKAPIDVQTYVKQNIEALKQDPESQYESYLEESGMYEQYFTEKYEKQYGKEAIGKEEPIAGTDIEAGKKGYRTRKGKKGTPKARRKIKDPRYKKALLIEPNTAHEAVLQYFIGGGKINPEAIYELFGDPKQKEMREEKRKNPKLYPNIKFKGTADLQARINYVNKNAPSIEGVAHYIWEQYDQRWDDVDIKNEVENVVNGYIHPSAMAEALLEAHDENRFNPQESAMIQVMKEAEKSDVITETENIIDAIETLPDNELEKGLDIFSDPNINPEDFFQKESAIKGDVKRIVDVIQKVLPNINVVYNPDIKAAGKLSADGKTISINPYYAELDTPIHEGGHVIIDAMGYNNVTIQAAIKQLRGTDLYKQTAKRYPELKGEMLDKEVLAEAIGREGAGIFDVEVKKNAFIKLLDRIFDWFKNKLGLDRNAAKTLAKRLIRGEFKEVKPTEVGVEQLQKPEEMSFEEFRKQKGRNIEQEESDLEALNDALEETEDEDLINQIEAAINVIEENIENDRAEFENFKKGIIEVEKIANAVNLKDFTLDELVSAYNDAKNYGGFADKEMLDKAKTRIAYYLNETGKERLSKHNKFISENANKKDLKWTDVWFKTLGHISQDFPELQEFYKIFNESWLDMMTERNNKKSELERLGKAVIKDYNKKHGVAERAAGLITSDSAKYFEYLEQDGKYRTNTAGLSKPQIELLNFMKNLVKDRKTQDEEGNLIDNEILKIDKGFQENWKDEGIIPAISAYMGGNNQQTEITFVNPNTGKQEKSTYKDAQKAILSYAKKGLMQKGIAMGKLLQIAYRAKKAGEKSNYGLNYNGQLTSKFDQPRDKDRGYSKDFYSAAMSFIDDQTHVTHMGKLVPLVDSIEQFYKYLGFEQGKSYQNTLKFIEQWKSEQIYQRSGETDPVIDKLLQFFRRLTSQIVMGFNVGANIMNVMMGNYNVWRAEGLKNWAVGQQRFFGGTKRSAYGLVNKKALDILKKYQIVAIDYESNPRAHIGKLFDGLAFAGGRWGEYQIQGSQFLGKLTPEEWASFEYDKDGNLIVKGDEKKIKQKMLRYKDEVSDIQGKYSEKDRRNFMRFEAGKSAAQFKVWIPDFLKERFGEYYIDSYGVEHRGSWNTLSKQAIDELKADWQKHKLAIAWKNETVRKNLSGAMAVAALMIATYGDDEDKKVRRSVLSLENAQSQLLFLLDPEQAKYMIKSPVASFGTIQRFIEALEAVMNMDAKKTSKALKRITPYGKALDVPADVEKLIEGK